MPAKVAALAVSDASMAPMRQVDTVILTPGVGIQGDRYAIGSGTYQAFKEPGRQLTVISGDSAAAAMAGLPRKLANGVVDLRRNVVLAGISGEALNDAVGCTLRLGERCEVLVHRRCVPCMYNERLNGVPGLMEAVWDVSGVNCEVLIGGELSVGDNAEVLRETFEEGRANDGGKKAAFFKRPSLRTRDEAKSMAGGLPRGRPSVDRVRAAYAAVGAGDAIGLSAKDVIELERERRRVKQPPRGDQTSMFGWLAVLVIFLATACYVVCR